MTHIPEVLEVMEGADNPTSKKPEKVLRIPHLLVISMSIIFLISLLASTFFFFKSISCDREDPLSRALSNIAASEFDEIFGKKTRKDLRLPKSILPDLYKIKIVPFIWEGNFTFNGDVSILVNVTETTDQIVLHSLNLNISHYSVRKLVRSIVKDDGREEAVESQSVQVSSTFYDSEKQFFIFYTDEDLQKGNQYWVDIQYVGRINDNLIGFYRSSYKKGNETRWLAATQFQATDARQAFPCFDEPFFKARFILRIARFVNMTAISNMPIIDHAARSKDLPVNYVIDTFKESVPMSTYLVAFAVTDFYKSTSKNFTVWARDEAINQADYALEIAPKLLLFYENFFQINFPLDKIDMIALPDFGSGAMENWGLITYRETAMLYQEGVSTRYNKENVATIVAHELAHQWFGNLVTPEWWSDLWLNEGFATYMEYIATDSVEPSWKILDQFVIEEEQGVLALDALVSSHPISVEVSDPGEINEIFDGISYSKGASIIRMMDHFLTRNVFRQGLTNYLRNKAYQCATQDDLWQALTEEAHRMAILDQSYSVKEIMDTWTLQTGFPVLNVHRNYRDNSMVVSQSRFFIGSENRSDDTSLWWVPLTYTSKSERDFKNTRPSYWIREKTRTIKDINVSENDWIIVNLQQTGYYRVNYDDRNWQMLIETLNDPDNFKMIDSVNRGQLINDGMKLAHAGYLKYSIALDIISYLHHDLEYIPWLAGFNVLGYLNEMLVKTPAYDKFKVWMTFLLTKMYANSGFFENQSDGQLEIYRRIEVLNYACRLGFEDCVRNSVNQFHNWRLTPQPDTYNPISPNLKSIVYCTAIRVGGYREWNFAWQRYLKSNVGTEKDILLGALGCTRETWILSRYLEWALNETSGIRKQDVVRVFTAVSTNAIGQPLAWAVLRDQWSRVVKYLGASLFGLGHIVRIVLDGVNTEHEINEIMSFALKHKSETGQASRAFVQTIGKAQSNHVWMKNNYDTIVAWLERTVAKLPSSIIDNTI